MCCILMEQCQKMNDEPTSRAIVLQRIENSIFAVFDEAQANIIVLAPTLETASTVFDDMVHVMNGDLNYLRNTVVGLCSLIEDRKNNVECRLEDILSKIRHEITNGTFSYEKTVQEIDAILDTGFTLSRAQRRLLYQANQVKK